MKATITLLFTSLLLLTSLPLLGQEEDYSQQITALKNAFEQRSIEGIQTYLDNGLKFDPIPVQQTKAVLTQFFKNFPPLESLETLETGQGYALLKFTLEGTRPMESAIHFNTSGQISGIELIEQAIQKEVEKSRSVQRPNPTGQDKEFSSVAIDFKAKDGLVVHGNLYEVDPKMPIILLCHQGMLNSYEYADIAPKLNQMGYNCLAIDQRSGGTFADRENITFQRAEKKGLNTDFLEAQMDMEAAIRYLKKRYHKRVILWGSSYSSILALQLANNRNVSAVISFSPSDYFKNEMPLLSEMIGKTQKPVLITSSKYESEKLSKSFESIVFSQKQVHHIPTTNGFHGSKSLWEGQKGSEEYWGVVKTFLSSL